MIIPLLHYSTTPLLHYSNTPLLRRRSLFGPGAVRLKLGEVFFRPTTKSLERLDQRASQFRKRIFYFGRHNRMHHTLHQAVALEAAQGLGEHFLRNPADLALKSGITHGPTCKNLNDERSPFVSNAIEYQPGGTARIEHRGS